MLNIRNPDHQCFRCCLIADELGTYSERYGLLHPERWNHYIENPPQGRRPKGFKPKYNKTDLTFFTVPKDRPMPLNLIGDWEHANHNKVGIYVYNIAHVELMGVSDEWVCIMRRPPQDETFEKDVKLLL